MLCLKLHFRVDFSEICLYLYDIEAIDTLLRQKQLVFVFTQ